MCRLFQRRVNFKFSSWLSVLGVFFGAGVFYFGASGVALADDPTYIGNNALNQSVGTGRDSANDGWTVTVGNGSTTTQLYRTDGSTVISLHDNDVINILNGATVQGNANSAAGHMARGPTSSS